MRQFAFSLFLILGMTGIAQAQETETPTEEDTPAKKKKSSATKKKSSKAAQKKPAAASGLLGSVFAARTAARRTASRNNMKQLGLAYHNYLDAMGKFPARVWGKGENKGLSWRVAVLPFLDEGALYKEFHLDEPWDSEHNKPLIEKMPAVFKSPESKAKAGRTVYVAPIGEGFISDSEEGTGIRDIKDGTSYTVMVVEAKDKGAVIWTKPDDWEYDAQQPFENLASEDEEGFHALFGDGAVRFISRNLDPEVWHSLLTRDGGETIPEY